MLTNIVVKGVFRMNRKDPRVTRTLYRLDQSLLENLKSCDFRKITVEMLCTKAKVNRSTFYKYYKDKCELLDSYLNRILKEFDEATTITGFVLASPYTISDEDYIQSFRRTITFIFDRREIYRILWNAAVCRPIYQEMKDIICRNVLNTLQPQDNSGNAVPVTPYHELYARLFASNLMTLAKWWLINEPVITLSDVESVMKGNMKAGLFVTFKEPE